MGTLNFGLHDILIYEMKNGEGNRKKYLEKEKEESIWRRKTFVGGGEKRRRIYFPYSSYFAHIAHVAHFARVAYVVTWWY